MKATGCGSFPRNGLQERSFLNYRTVQGACAPALWTYLSGVNLLQRVTKKGIAFPGVRAHSDFTAIKFSIFFGFCSCGFAGKIFNPRAIGGFL
jgi:hypothetical protein